MSESSIRQHGICIGWLIVFVNVAVLLTAAQSSIRGTVTDAVTGEALPGVTIAVPNTTFGTSTDSLGRYVLRLDSTAPALLFSAMGYKPVSRRPARGSTILDVELEPESQTLAEVVVRGKGRYRNRDNPAVELIRKVIAYKSQNRLSRFDHISYQQYEKILMAVSHLPKFITNSPLTRDYRFAFENVDTTLVPGRALLPLFLEETVSTHYLRAQPQAAKTIVTANKKTQLDPQYVNNENIETYFRFIHNDIDIYDDNILLLNKPFLGPVSEAAPLFYKFFITDTIRNSEGTFAELTFSPRNKKDRLFSGKLLIALDGTYGIKQADIRIDRQANLNWVNDAAISLRFGRHQSGTYVPTYSDVKINFGVFDSKQGVFGQRTLVFNRYDTETTIAEKTFSGQSHVTVEGADARSEQYWSDIRPLKLSGVEARTYANVDSLRNNRAFRRTLQIGYLIAQSYVNAGPVEFGPLEYSYSFNDLEGSRVRLSGRTTRQFSEKWYAEGYAAYGFRDTQLKWYGSLSRTLNTRRIGVYPAHYLQFTYHRDAREPGQLLGFRNGDSFSSSFRSGEQDKWSYFEVFKLNHAIEFGNHVLLQTSFTSQRQRPAARLHFITADAAADTMRALQTSDLGIHLRWAPNEAYFQRNLERTPIINAYPVFNFRYNIGFTGLFGGEYNYHAFRMDILKRIFLSQLGYADVNFGAGYIFGTVPFPLLEIPNANKTYLLLPDSYSLMNNLEFASDQYLKLRIEHRLHGFILNKIPLIKQLKLRELASVKLLYGDIRPENRPENNRDVFRFPTDTEGNPITFTLGRKPYVEASFGVENILNVLRIEYVRRLSYLDHPGINKGGIRFSVKVDF